MLVLVPILLLCACVSGFASHSRKKEPVADEGSYLFNPSPLIWSDATKVCNGYNSQLAYPKTTEEAEALWDIMTRYNVSQVHVGFHDLYTEGQYISHKGKLVKDSSFHQMSASLVGITSLNCGALKVDGFQDVSCSTEKLPSICEENAPTEEGYLDYDFLEGFGYYKLYYNKVEWSRAFDTCYNEGSHLFIINSRAETDAVKNLYPLSYSTLWVGVHHLYADGVYTTVLGDTLDSTGYTQWQVGQPTGNSRMYPFLVHNSVQGFALEVERKEYAFVCEYTPNQNNLRLKV